MVVSVVELAAAVVDGVVADVGGEEMTEKRWKWLTVGKGNGRM